MASETEGYRVNRKAVDRSRGMSALEIDSVLSIAKEVGLDLREATVEVRIGWKAQLTELIISGPLEEKPPKLKSRNERP